MILALCIFAVADVFDSFGVKFDNIYYERLILAPSNLVRYQVPQTTKIISGGSIDQSPFRECRSVLTELTFSEGSLLETIEPYALSELILKSIDFSMCERLKILNIGILRDCKSLESIKLPPNLTRVRAGSLQGLTKITSIEFPSTVTQIDSYYDSISICACCCNSRLSNVTFGKDSQLKSIGSIAFSSDNISVFHIGPLLSSISTEVLINNPITLFDIDPRNKNYSTEGSVLFNYDKTSVVFCPKSITGSYNPPSSVTSYGAGAFMSSYVDTVIVSDNITSFGNDCFMYSRITSITVPSSVKFLGSRCFLSCSRLKEVIFNPNISALPYAIFQSCPMIEEVILPRGIETIQSSAFSSCKNIDHIWIPNTVTSIMSSVFKKINSSCFIELEENSQLKIENFTLFTFNLKRLISYIGSESSLDVYIAKEVETIGGSAYTGQTISSIVFDPFSDLTTIEDSAFSGCSIESIVLPSSCRSLGAMVFEGSTLRLITLSSDLETIGDKAFASSKIVSISLPSNVITIGASAFANCQSLMQFTISPSSGLKEIQKEAFASSAIKSILIPIAASIIGFDILNRSSVTNIEFASPSAILRIPDYSFRGCTKLTSITFGYGIEQINPGAFESCTSFEVLEIGPTIKTLCTHCCKDCTGLLKVRIPNDSELETIEALAFDGCSSLVSFDVDDTNPSFTTKDGVLYNKNISRIILYLAASELKEFHVPLTVAEISAFAFRAAKNLQSIVIPDGEIKTLGAGCFMDCTSLEYISIPNSVVNVYSNIFAGCTSLKCGSINYHDSILTALIDSGAPIEALKPCDTAEFDIKLQRIDFLLAALASESG